MSVLPGVTARRVVWLLCVAVTMGALAGTAAAAGAPQATPAAPVAAAASQPPPPLTGPMPQQDAPGPADQAAGTTVSVSFANNFIADRLPFDVPFFVTGNVDTAVQRLALTVYRVSTSANLASLITYLQTTVDCVGPQSPGSPVSESTSAPGAGGGFSLLVNALEPQYYYAFCFLGVSPVASSEIETDVRRILAATLPRVETQGDITVALLEAVHGVMRDRIAQLGAGRPVPATIPAGNLFAASAADARFGDLVRDLSEPYGSMETAADDYTTSLRELLSDVAVARKGPANAFLTTEVLAELPPANRTLPTRESAVTGEMPFNSGAYTFEPALTGLNAAVSAAPPDSAESKILTGLVSGLEEVVDAARLYGIFYDRLRGASATFVSYVALEARAVTVTLGSSVLSADLARNVYVSMDAGIAYPWRLESMVFYAGTNIYFRPINKAAPLRYKGTFLHRFALTVGLTTTVKDDSRRAQDLRATAESSDTSNSLLLGGGLRVTPSLRLGAGVLVFKEKDPNPLITQTSVAVTPYVALAADVDVAEIFRSLF